MHPAALSLRGRRGHVQPGDVPARARARAVERGVRRAVAPPEGRPLRREPEPLPAVLPVPGAAQAVAGRRARPLLREPRSRSASISRRHDLRLVEDDWESPTLGAWGLGWQVWMDGMEITQFTYFQQVGGIELRAGLGRDHLRPRAHRHDAPGQDRVQDLRRPRGRRGVTWGDLWLQNEIECSRYNFEEADVDALFDMFEQLGERGRAAARRTGSCCPGYDA